MWSGFAVMVGALLSGGIDASTEGPADQFQAWFRTAVDGKLVVPRPVARKAQSYRYVFVGGLRNERMRGYFARNMDELRDLGIPGDQIHVIHPSSHRTTGANAEDVRARFLEIAAEGPERLVVIAHSRGACDTLAFALDDPKFVRDRVEAMYLIQGPFGGSGLAGYVTGSGVPMDRQMKLRHRIIGNLIGRLVKTVTKGAGLEVVEGMTPEASATFWAKALDKDPETLAAVGAKTFFIRSSLHPSRQRFARRAMAWYLQTYHGPSDGMVTLEDQSLPGFGTVVATLEAAHSDLTCNPPSSRSRRWDRRALVGSIVMAVGQPRASADPSALRISPSRPGGRSKKGL
jgi:pimeloyl-ACP methyl ester carboxylesterase